MMAKRVSINRESITSGIARALGDSISEPSMARLGNPETNEVLVPVGVDGGSDIPGMVWIFDVGDGTDQRGGLGQALNSGPGKLRRDELVFGNYVLIKKRGKNYVIAGRAYEEAAEYENGFNPTPQITLPLDNFDVGLLKPTSPASMTALVGSATYVVNRVPYLVGQRSTIDFTDSIPATAGMATAVLVEIIPSLGTLEYTTGGLFAASLTHAQAFDSYPKPDVANVGRKVVGWIKLVAGMTEILAAEHILPAQEILGLLDDHGLLDGLLDDDHTQYLLIDGSRAMTGSLDMNNKQVRNVSLLTFRAVQLLTINVSGAISAVRIFHTVAAFSGTADDLVTITPSIASVPQMIVIQADTGDTITVKHGTGNISLYGAADVTITGYQRLMLWYDGSTWTDIAPSGGGGSSSPVAGDWQVLGHGAYGADAGIDTAGPNYPAQTLNGLLVLGETFSDLTTKNYNEALRAELLLDPAANATSQYIYGINASVISDAANTKNTWIWFGLNAEVRHVGSGTVHALNGGVIEAIRDTGGGGGAVSSITGLYVDAEDGDYSNGLFVSTTKSASITGANQAYGIYNYVSNVGVVTSGSDQTYGEYIDFTRTGATGGTIDSYGLYISMSLDNAGGGTHSGYGIYVGAVSGADANYALYTNAGLVHLGDDTDWAEGKNLIFGTTTGSKLGSTSSQKIGLWGASPVAQYNTTGTTTGFTAGGGTAVDSAATFTGNTGSTAYTIGDIVKALKLAGIMAS